MRDALNSEEYSQYISCFSSIIIAKKTCENLLNHVLDTVKSIELDKKLTIYVTILQMGVLKDEINYLFIKHESGTDINNWSDSLEPVNLFIIH